MMNYSPWPDEGKRWRFEWRAGVWMLVRPWYGAHDVIYELHQITWMSPVRFWFPFIAFRSRRLHFYLGWKPIPVHQDNAFFWNKTDIAKKFISENRLFVQLGARCGVGSIS